MHGNLMGHTQYNLIDPKLKEKTRMQNVLNSSVELVNILEIWNYQLRVIIWLKVLINQWFNNSNGDCN